MFYALRKALIIVGRNSNRHSKFGFGQVKLGFIQMAIRHQHRIGFLNDTRQPFCHMTGKLTYVNVLPGQMFFFLWPRKHQDSLIPLMLRCHEVFSSIAELFVVFPCSKTMRLLCAMQSFGSRWNYQLPKFSVAAESEIFPTFYALRS